VLVWLHP
jgi:hypothetical protein